MTVLLAGVALLVSLGVSLAAYLLGENPKLLFRDLASSAGVDPLWGGMSALGIMLWTTAAAVSLFTAAIMRARSRPDLMRFSLYFGVFSAMLAIDDQFMIHETLLHRIIPTSQAAYVVVYGGVLIAFLVTQHYLLFDRLLPLLLGAGLFLGGSVALDMVSDLLHVESAPMSLGEDVLKAVGIVLWCAYGLMRSYGFVMSGDPQAGASREPAQDEPAAA